MKVSIVLVCLIAAVWRAAAASPALPTDSTSVRGVLQRAANDLSFLSVPAIVADRPLRPLMGGLSAEEESHNRWMNELSRLDSTDQELLRLVSDPEARVRTLAAIALFQRENAKVLPNLAQLLDDKSQTFDALDEFPGSAAPGAPRERTPQTVGDVAYALIQFYLREGVSSQGFPPVARRGPGVQRPRLPFRDYWAARADRSFCAGWFSVQLARASRLTTPVDTNRYARIRAVRSRIDELPAPDRAWTLLFLGGGDEEAGRLLITEEELVQSCKDLGPEALLKLLQYEIPSSDPDLQPRKRDNHRYTGMCLFVLRHGRELLRPIDSERLLECERWQGRYQERGDLNPLLTPYWVIAAAELDPDHSIQMLREAYDRYGTYWDRSALSLALWRRGGPEQLPFILDWFFRFNPVPERGACTHSQAQFIQKLRDEKDRSVRPLVAALIGDPRFQKVGWQSLASLGSLVATWTEPPIFTTEELHAPWHPLGICHYESGTQNPGDAARNFPDETRQLETTLGEWRGRLVESVPRWLKEP